MDSQRTECTACPCSSNLLLDQILKVNNLLGQGPKIANPVRIHSAHLTHAVFNFFFFNDCQQLVGSFQIKISGFS